MSLKPKVALSQDFLLQLSKLPSSVHSKVMKWAIQFQSDPTSPGINYENIQAARDANLKSVRLDRDWRGIVFKPSTGDVYVLLYVDHHDAAYRWAENRKLAINPVTGAMQMVVFEQATESVPAATPGAVTAYPQGEPTDAQTSTDAAPLFGSLDNQDLLSLGVPEELIPDVRALRSETELDSLQGRLPLEGYEGLFLVAAGDTVNQVLQSRETRVDKQVNTSDFAAALSTPESQSRFFVVDDDEAMVSILNAPLAQWRVFLHPTQHKLASGDRSGPVRVLGGAGTGKTVLAMHRAKWLAENRTADGKKVLFTTFTKNLAADIEQNLKTLCTPATMDRIEVKNLDAWVHGYMRSLKLEHRIVYDRKQDGAQQAWQAALAVRDTKLDLPDNFYVAELEQVVLAQGITSREQYRVARRTGRASVLSRAMRDAVWPVFEEYRGQLSSRKLKEVDDAYREVADLLNASDEGRSTYSAIVIDETQDFGPQALRLIRALIAPAPNDLFFVGDGHQRIYSRHKAAMSKCGIDIRGRARKLYLNYRTTDEIRRRAVALLEGCEVDDLDDGHDETRLFKSLSHGPEPMFITVSGIEAAAAQVIGFIKAFRQEGGGTSPSVCVIASSERNREALATQVQAAGLTCVTITALANHTDRHDVVHFATMHRAKGLEFDAVIVVAPDAFFASPEETGNERRLMYVGLTRARKLAALVKLS